MLVHRWGAVMAGGEVWIKHLVDSLAPAGACFHAALHYRGPLWQALAEQGVRTHRLNLHFVAAGSRRELLVTGLGVLASGARLARLVWRTGTRLLHAFSPEAAEPAFVAARLTRRPLVVSMMNCGPYPALDRFVLRRVDRVIAISQAVFADLVVAGIGPDRIDLIPLGINFAQLAEAEPGALRRQIGLPRQTPLIGVVATLERHKAQDVMIAAMPRILAAVPEVHLALIGRDHLSGPARPGPYEAELRQLVACNQVAHRVHFLGYQPRAQRLVGDLDVAVLCSRREALGLTAIEALAHGVPLVATATQGLREVVSDSTTGLLVPPDDPEALSRAVIELLTDRARARQLAERGRLEVRERYDAARLARRNLELYQSLLTRPGAPSR